MLQLPTLGHVCEGQRAARGRRLRLRADQRRKEDDDDGRPCRQEEERWPVCYRGLIISSCPPFLLHFGMQYVVPTCHSKLNWLYLVMHLHENAMAHFVALLRIVMLTNTSLYGSYFKKFMMGAPI